jgi:hypothetical protein
MLKYAQILEFQSRRFEFKTTERGRSAKCIRETFSRQRTTEVTHYGRFIMK